MAVLCVVFEVEEGMTRIEESVRSFLACGATGLYIADLAAKPRDLSRVKELAAVRNLPHVQEYAAHGSARDKVYNVLMAAAIKDGFEFGLVARSHDLLKQNTDGQMVESLPDNLANLDVLQVCTDARTRSHVDVCIRLSEFYFLGSLNPVPFVRADSKAWLRRSPRLRAAPWHNVGITSLAFSQPLDIAMQAVVHTRCNASKWKRFMTRAGSAVTEYDLLVNFQLIMQAAEACFGAGLVHEALRLFSDIESKDVNGDKHLLLAAKLGACRAALYVAERDKETPALSLFIQTAELGMSIQQVDGVAMLHNAIIARDAPRTAGLLLHALAALGPKPAVFMTDPSLRTYGLRACLAEINMEAARAVAAYRPMLMNDETTSAHVKHFVLPTEEPSAAIAAHFAPAMTLCQSQFVYVPMFVTDAPGLFTKLQQAALPLAWPTQPGVWATPAWPRLLNAFQRAVMPTRSATWGTALEYRSTDVAQHVNVKGAICFPDGLTTASIRANTGYMVVLFQADCVVKLNDSSQYACAAGALLGLHDTLACTLITPSVPVLIAHVVAK